MSKKLLSTMLVSLLALSIFAFTIPSAFAATYTLTVEAVVEDRITSYEDSVRIAPGPDPFDPANPEPYEILTPITVGVYLTDYCSEGGLKKDTKAHYVELVESQNYEIKVPVSAIKGQWKVLFEHWEVWDDTTDAPLEWLGGINEEHIYTGSWEYQGVTYTRITKLIATPKYGRVIRPEIAEQLEAKYQAAQKELLDRSDGILEPYLRFGIHNPDGGGDKLLIAVYHLQWGPETEHLYFQTILSPDAALDAFLINSIDAMTDLIRTSDVDTLEDDGAVITSTPGFHMCYIAQNMRLSWGGPQDGGEPGRSLRHACANLLPKDTLISTLFRYIVVRIDTFMPPSLEEWYNPEVTIYDYDPDLAYQTLIAGGWVYDSGLGTWRHPATGAVAGGEDATIQVLCPLEIVAPTSFTIVGRYVDEMNALTDPDGNPTPLKAEQAALDFWEIVIRAFQTREFEQYFLCWGDISEEILYFVYHSSMDVEWMDNSPGLHNDDVDDLVEIVEFGMDHDEKVQASKDAQALLAEILPLIPIYSRNYFSAHQPDYYGMVLVPGIGIDSEWTWLNVKGPRLSPTYLPPLTQIQGDETIWQLGEACESYNPSEAGSVYAWTVLETMYEEMINTNPYTLKDKPWLAKDWVIHPGETMTTPHGASMVDGMYIEYILDDRVVEGKVRWHDGEVWDANDIMFSWQYVWDNELTNWYGFYETLIDIDNPSPDKVVAYWNESSQWLLYDGAGGAGCYYAPQVWGYVDTDNDGLNYLDDGDIEGDISIRAYTPEDHPRSDLGAYTAQPAFPWLSQAIGQGPFVLYSASEDGYHSHLFAFDTRSHTTVVPDVHYWKSKSSLKEQKIEMFYHLGDVSLDAIVDTLDLARMGLHILETGPTYPSGDYKGFIQEDVTEDGIINIVDLATAGKNFGKEKEY